MGHDSKGKGRGREGRGNRDGSKQYQNFKTSGDQFHGNDRGRDQHFNKSKVECYKCHNYCYYHSKCYTKLPKYKEKSERSNFVEKKEK